MTKKMFIIAAAGLAMLSSAGLSADDRHIRHLDTNGNGIYEEGEVDPCKEYRGPVQCVCTYPVTKFKKKTWCTKRCVKEPYTVKKKCVRYKNEYYTKTFCRKVPETYYTTHTRYRDRWVTDEHCRYEPCTYYKRECMKLNECPACDDGGCPADSKSNMRHSQAQPNETPISNRETRKSRHY